MKDYNILEEEERREPMPGYKRTNILLYILVACLFLAMVIFFFVVLTINLNISAEEITANVIVMSFISVVIIVIMRYTRLNTVRHSEEHDKAQARVQEQCDIIVKNGYSRHTAQYCREWERERYQEAVRGYIELIGLSYDEWEKKYRTASKKTIKKSELSDGEKQILLSAREVKQLEYDERYLFPTVSLSKRSKKRKAPSENNKSARYESLSIVKTILCMIVFSFLSAGLTFVPVYNITREVVAMCIYRVVSTAGSSVIGSLSAESHAKMEIDELNAKANDMSDFVKWCEINFPEEV